MAVGDRNVGERESLDTLSDEFKYNKHFGAKVKELQDKGYDAWRRMRGDGNCYWRSVGFGWLEEILAAPRELQKAWARTMLEKLQAVTPHLDSSAKRDAHTRLLSHVKLLADGVGWQEGSREMTQQERLYASFSDAKMDLALVLALRILIGNYLLANADDSVVCNGISFRILCSAQGEGSPEDFCRRKVFAMGVEAETQIIRATVQALGIELQIVLIDRDEGSKLCFENYDVVGDEGGEHPLVHVQLRPGHYDLLYCKVPRTLAIDNKAPLVAEEEYQRYFCSDCGCPFLWRPSDKPDVRCKCGRDICAACLAEACRPNGWASIFSTRPKKSPEHICAHVAARLEVLGQEQEAHATAEQDVENYAAAVRMSEEHFQQADGQCKQLEQALQEERARGEELQQALQEERAQGEELQQALQEERTRVRQLRQRLEVVEQPVVRRCTPLLLLLLSFLFAALVWHFTKVHRKKKVVPAVPVLLPSIPCPAEKPKRQVRVRRCPLRSLGRKLRGQK